MAVPGPSTITFRDGRGNNLQGQVLDQTGAGNIGPFGLGPFTLGWTYLDGVAGILAAGVTASNAVLVSYVAQPVSGALPVNIGTPGPAMLEAGNLATLTGAVSAGRLQTKKTRSATATTTSVAASGSSVTILAANANRLGADIYNDSTVTLFLLLGAGPASLSAYTVQVMPTQFLQVPFNYTGAITGIWTSGGSGNARVVELS